MVQKSPRSSWDDTTPGRNFRLFQLLRYLDAADELIRDKTELREAGLSEEEVEGYEEFYFDEYFPILEEV